MLLSYISKNFYPNRLPNMDSKFNFQQNTVCSVNKFSQVLKFYTNAGCDGCDISHVCTLHTPYSTLPQYTLFCSPSCHLSFQVLSIPSWPPRTSVNISLYLPDKQEYCFHDCRKLLQFSVHCSSLCSQEKVSPLSFGLSISGSIWCYTLWYIFFIVSLKKVTN